MAAARGGRNALVILLVFIAVVVVVIVALQGNEDSVPDSAGGQTRVPPRRVEREAPLREPIVLEESEGSEGGANVLVVLAAEADATIASDLPDESFGMGSLYLGQNVGGGFGAERILLSFNVAENLPEGAVINGAALRMHVESSTPPEDTPMETWVGELVSPWNELTVTWDDGPDWGPVHAGPAVASELRWYEWDVTAQVQAWVSGALENHGVGIAGFEDDEERERSFYARETPTEGAAAQFYPQLIVDYTTFDDADPPVTEVDPLPAYVLPAFLISWSGEDRGSAGIRSYDVDYRIDGGDWTRWLTGVDFTSIYFEGGENLRVYEFRVRAQDWVGNVEPFGDAQARTTVDGEPPRSDVRELPPLVHETPVDVIWVGHDHGSGIRYYDVRYRLDGGGWTLWQQRTLATTAAFSPPADGRYDFEARAVDELGQQEPFTGLPEASVVVDARAPFVEP